MDFAFVAGESPVRWNCVSSLRRLEFPQTVFLPRAFVFEKQPRWLPELQRQFQGEEIVLQGCEKISDLPKLLEEPCLIVLDLDSDPQNCLQYLAQRSRRLQRNLVLVIGSPRNSVLEWSVRELGAATWLENTVEGDRLARICQRYWEQLHTLPVWTQTTESSKP